LWRYLNDRVLSKGWGVLESVEDVWGWERMELLEDYFNDRALRFVYLNYLEN
jgi:hypothetical protein